MSRPDYFTNTPEQAAAYEARRAEPDDDRPTRMEADRDEWTLGDPDARWPDEFPRAAS